MAQIRIVDPDIVLIDEPSAFPRNTHEELEAAESQQPLRHQKSTRKPVCICRRAAAPIGCPNCTDETLPMKPV